MTIQQMSKLALVGIINTIYTIIILYLLIDILLLNTIISSIILTTTAFFIRYGVMKKIKLLT